MITVGLYYEVLPGKGPEFRDKFREVVAAMKQSVAGHKATFLYQQVDDPDSFAIISEWEDRASFLAFIRSEAFRQVTSWGRETVLRSAPRHKLYPSAEDIGRPPA